MKLLLALASLAAAAPSAVRHVMHEKREESSNWVKLDRVHEHEVLPVRIGLTQSNLDNIDDLLYDV